MEEEIIVVSESDFNFSTHEKFIWDRNMVYALIEEYKKRVSEFENPSYKKRRLWSKIAHAMRVRGFKMMTDEMCDIKWRNLKKTFKEIYFGKRSTVKWEYYNVLKHIFEKDMSFYSNFGAAHRRPLLSKKTLNKKTLAEEMELEPDSSNSYIIDDSREGLEEGHFDFQAETLKGKVSDKKNFLGTSSLELECMKGYKVCLHYGISASSSAADKPHVVTPFLYPVGDWSADLKTPASPSHLLLTLSSTAVSCFGRASRVPRIFNLETRTNYDIAKDNYLATWSTSTFSHLESYDKLIESTGLYSLRANRPVPRLTLSFQIRSKTDATLEALIGQESAPKPPPPLKDHTCKNSSSPNFKSIKPKKNVAYIINFRSLRLLKRLPKPVQEWHFTHTITLLYDYNTVHRTWNDGMMRGGKPKNINKEGGFYKFLDWSRNKTGHWRRVFSFQPKIFGPGILSLSVELARRVGFDGPIECVVEPTADGVSTIGNSPTTVTGKQWRLVYRHCGTASPPIST
uniref:Myb/SANT-like DNA-binding domain-containing protein n=1 Tax=Timema poppense TaxID=170557 RepID=A0A7R9CM78_TIMPO|nr:unnamed protein product [Timema poppensis]